MSEVDRILRELAAISSQLEGDVDPDSRRQLAERRQELHAEARLLATVPGDETALQARLGRLEAEWDRLRKQRIDVVKQAGGGGPGGDFGFATDAMSINRAIDASGGREELEREIKYLRARLKSADEK